MTTRVGHAVAARTIGGAIQFLLGVVLARLLGPAGLGTFLVFLSVAQIGASVAHLGFPTLALRVIPVMRADAEYDKVSRFVRASVGIVITGSAVLLIVGVLLRHELASVLFKSRVSATVVALGVCAAAPLAIAVFLGEALKAFERPVVGLTIQFIAPPATVLMWVGVLIAQGKTPTDVDVIAAYVIAGFVAATAGFIALAASFRGARRIGDSQRENPARLSWGPALAYWVTGLLSQLIASMPFLILARVSSSADIGVYGAADRLTSIAVLILVGVVAVYAPQFSEAHFRSDAHALQRLLGESRLLATVLYSFPLVLFLAGGRWILAVFGGEFGRGAGVLQVLALAQLLNTLTGAAAYFNFMTEGERFEALWSMVVLVGLMGLGLLLGAYAGYSGVAWATAIMLSMKNLVSFVRARRLTASMPLAPIRSGD